MDVELSVVGHDAVDLVGALEVAATCQLHAQRSGHGTSVAHGNYRRRRC